MANIMTKTDDILSEINPDATFILGDTNSSIAGLVAKRKKIHYFILRQEIDVLTRESS